MLRSARVSLALVIGASWIVLPASPLAGSACAEPGPHAVLVVDRNNEGGPLPPLCIALRGEAVSGERFLRLASAQYDLQVDFGHYSGQGPVVCQIANVGPEGEQCLEGAETYWGYWKGDGSGGWVTYANKGVDDSVVTDGDVEGWSYARGANEPPSTTFEEGCAALLAEDEPTPSPSPSSTPSPSSSPKPTPTPTKAKLPPPSPEPDRRRLDVVPDLSELHAAPTPSPTTSEVVLPPNATASGADEDGSPLAGVLALVATFAMAGVALLLVRKRVPVKPED